MKNLRSKSSFRPNLEALENRTNMSCVIWQSSTTLNILGDVNANNVAITQTDNINNLKVECDGVTHNFISSHIKKINANLDGGDDVINWGLGAGSNYVYSKSAIINMHSGNDEAWLDFRGGGIGGSATLYNTLSALVDAGTGDDLVLGHFGEKRGGSITLQAIMGDGNDEARAMMWGDLKYNAKVTFLLQGGGDNDELGTWNTFDSKAYSYNDIDIEAGSMLNIYMDSGIGNDSVTATYSGEVDGRLYLTEVGADGNDRLEADVALQAGSTGYAYAREYGGNHNDYHRLYAYQLPGSTATVNAHIDGGAGWDSCYKTSNVTKVNCEFPLILVPPTRQ